MKIDFLLGKVWCGDAVRLLRTMPSQSVHAVITDPMYGTAPRFEYEWGVEPARGDPKKHWQYHEPIYKECLRILKPEGILAWCQGVKFAGHFPNWFGPHTLWPLATSNNGWVRPQFWIVQRRERQPGIPLPYDYGLLRYGPCDDMPVVHPCPKCLEEMLFLIRHLTQPGQIVCDCCCGTGTTLLAAEQLGRRWIGCDRSSRYCAVAEQRVADYRTALAG